MLANLSLGHGLVFIQTPLPVEDSLAGVPDRPGALHDDLLRHLALRRGLEGEVERLRYERSQIVLVVGEAQNHLDPEGSS